MHALVAWQDGALHTANRTAMYLYDQLAATSGFLHYYRKLWRASLKRRAGRFQ